MPSVNEIDSATCVTPHGQGFSINWTFGDIPVKYSYKSKNFYHHEGPDIIGEM